MTRERERERERERIVALQLLPVTLTPRHWSCIVWYVTTKRMTTLTPVPREAEQGRPRGSSVFGEGLTECVSVHI